MECVLNTNGGVHPERVWSVRVIRDWLSGGWASGNGGGLRFEGIPASNYFDPLLYPRCAGKTINGYSNKIQKKLDSQLATRKIGKLSQPRSCRGCPVLQVPRVWPCPLRLRLSQQEECLLEVW